MADSYKNARHRIAAALLVCMPLAACDRASDTPPPQPDASTGKNEPVQPTSMLGRAAAEGIREARAELARENIGLNDDIHIHSGKRGVGVFDDKGKPDARPKAEITPQGDLLIAGKPVAIDAAQRKLLLDYRARIITVAESGMAIGVQGADLAAKAMGAAFKGIFSGQSEQEIERSVEAETDGIKQAAAQLCGHLPALLTSQQALAAALPEFRPYATMTQQEVDDCMKDDEIVDATKRAQQSRIREEIRSTIRETVRGSAHEVAAETAAETAAEDSGSDAAAKR